VKSSVFKLRGGAYLTRHLAAHDIVAYLLKARAAEPQKHPLLDNDCVLRNKGVTVGNYVFSSARAEAI
jgi:hypothetical protein